MSLIEVLKTRDRMQQEDDEFLDLTDEPKSEESDDDFADIDEDEELPPEEVLAA